MLPLTRKFCLGKSEVDPGAVFIRKDVQDLLTNITGFDLSRIFRTQTNKNFDRIVYKYLTDKQLKEVRMYKSNMLSFNSYGLLL